MAQQASKPFDIQSPQKIAMEYGGNKQKIAQAMQLGIVDSTAGVLAGMFIDKMRSAQMQEQAQQPTIAQQVMGGAQPSPAAGAPPAGGIGASPQGALPMAPPPPPQGGMPPAPPMGAPPQGAPPMGMADGGLASLPIPDNMFDEPTNGGFDDGYSGGGLVAFADGGDTLGWMDTGISSEYGVSRSTGRHQGRDYRTPGGTPIGAVAPGVVKKAGYDDINGNYVVVQHPDGSSTSYAHLAKLSVAEGQPVSTGGLLGLSGNTGRVRGAGGGYHLHLGARDAQGNRVDPRSMLGRLGELQKLSAPSGVAPLPERNTQTAEGRRMSREDQLQLAEELYGRLPSAGYEEAEEYYRKARDPEEIRKQRKEDMWATLAQIGASMASSRSPYFLQAAGEAIASALPGAAASRKERKEAERDAIRGLMEVNKLRRGEAKEILTYANQAYGTELEVGEKQADRAWRTSEAEKERAARRAEAQMQINATLEAARISASAKERDLMTTAVMNKYAELQKINAGRPLRQGNEPFDPNRHRLADETVFDNAFKSVIGTRYPKTSGDTGYGLPGGGGAAPSNQYSGFTAEQVG